MRRIEYTLKLLSGIILNSGSSSEGVNEPLHYIPGSKMLGIVAGFIYNSDSTETLDLFHNGRVRYGDAHLMGNNERSLKIPANWSYEKGGKLTDTIFISGENGNLMGNNPKPVKEQSYFTSIGELLQPYRSFSLKSAYDADKKRARDKQMYGYYSLARGSIWSFHVDILDERLVDKVNNALIGTKRIGRSRSSEFGLVEIERKGELEFKGRLIKKGEIILYAESNLCFYDEFGHSTPKPGIQQLNLPEKSRILWEKSRINTRIYQSWNRKRYNRDADRCIIEKGSIIKVELADDIDSVILEGGIGSHLVEGFGKVIINPGFCESDTGKLKLRLFNKKAEILEDHSPVITDDESLIPFLQWRKEQADKIEVTDKLINAFIEKHHTRFSRVSSSQWGQVRNYAKFSVDENSLREILFNKKTGFFYHGKSEENWRRSRDILEKFFDQDCIPGMKNEIIIKLASERVKEKEKIQFLKNEKL